MDGTDVTLGLDTASLISLVIGFVLPVIVGLVTTRITSSTVKAVLLLLLSAVSGLLSTFLNAVNNDVRFDWPTALFTALVTFVIAVATHFGLWKPTGVSARAQAVGAKAPNA